MVSFTLREDTIAAICTPPGRGAVGAIRVSGPEVPQVFIPFWQGPSIHRLRPRVMTHGRWVDSSGEVLDEVLICWMKAPRSYTGEQVAEVYCHGNPHILGEVLQTLIGTGKVRLAEPGEFTFRAFRNGRMTLVQAEAVAELIEAKGTWARKNALSLLAEGGDRWVQELLDSLLDIWVPIEADLEFPTDDLDSLDLHECLPAIQELRARILDLTGRATRFSRLQEGFRVVLAGPQNAGKSSLLNALLGYSRALVTDIPGTTRDTLEEAFEIEGIPIRLIDTAGLGETEDRLDALGMEKSRAALSKADLVVAVCDISSCPPPSQDATLAESFPDIAFEAGGPLLLWVGNKEDLLPQDSPWRDQTDLILVSALRKTGLEGLTRKICSVLTQSGVVDLDERRMLNQRQAELLVGCLESLDRCRTHIRDRGPQDLVATDLLQVKQSLEELSGQTLQVDLMETLFSRFCIGK